MRIYLNAGHGGYDTGAVGVKVEKEETLRLAKDIKPLLESTGHSVIMSRETDSYLSVIEIADDANARSANLFVAIHLNASDGKGHGTECLIVSGASATSKLVAAEINKRIASLGFTNRGVKVQDTRTYVLSHTKMPATTVEVCFIDNTDDMQLYAIKYKEIVRAITEGILAIAGGSIQNKGLIYEATRNTAFMSNAKGVNMGDEVELLSYKSGDTFATVKFNGLIGLVAFSDFKKGE